MYNVKFLMFSIPWHLKKYYIVDTECTRFCKEKHKLKNFNFFILNVTAVILGLILCVFMSSFQHDCDRTS